ncbi:MAG: efflux RND transporter permease subunit [Pseudomonadales bacterium]
MIDFLMGRNRTVLLLLAFLMIAGTAAFIAIPKESDPDIPIPFIYISMIHEGISPEDAERLLIQPMEKELRNITGLKEMKSTASAGYASVILEFEAGFDAKQALLDVRSQVELAKRDLPTATESPSVNEINTALFPVMTLSISAAFDERQLIGIARQLKREIIALPNVLSVEIGGDREEVLEVEIDPVLLDGYQIDFQTVMDVVSRNNLLVTAGALDTGTGRMIFKVPGVIDELNDILQLPIKVNGSTVVTFADIARLRSTFKDPEGFARVDGKPAISLEISKRSGANIIETVTQVQAVVAAAKQVMPEQVDITYILDQSAQVSTLLWDLLNNILSAMVIVMIIIIAVLGLRSALLVGLAIPGSFLIGILLIFSLNITMNIVVLFSLILVVGMLVDAAIVVVEMADTRLKAGDNGYEAFSYAARQMAWPIIASTLTTLAVFIPLAFWPGTVGEFMKYLPITVVVCLLASLCMALIFLPVLGYMFNRSRTSKKVEQDRSLSIGSKAYMSLLKSLVKHPGKTLVATLTCVFSVYALYGLYGVGIEFFPDTEPETAMIQVHARGDLSVIEKDKLLRQVENRMIGMDDLRSVYARSFAQSDSDGKEDLIGVVQFRFTDWHQRSPAKTILRDIQQRTTGIPGLYLDIVEEEGGPSGGKPIEIEVSGLQQDLSAAVELIRDLMIEIKGFNNVEDNRPLPGIEWLISVNRQEAARYGADIASIGNAVQMVTAGINLTKYRPNNAYDEIDVRARFPQVDRTLQQLENLRIKTAKGMIPVKNFVEIIPSHKTNIIQRVDGRQVATLKSDILDGLLVDAQLKKLQKGISELDFPASVALTFKGEDADQQESMAFLLKAFLVALFIMLLILVTQFNSVYQSLLVLSAIIFSTAGVMLGLFITHQPFGIVMGGIGVIALAGIVVNNNIILIDAYNRKREQGVCAIEAAIATGSERLRPVLLTSVTTITGLIPMAYGLNLDLINRQIGIGAPSSQMWTQLASTIAGGLSFATLLTLFLTPCMLVMGDRYLSKTA